MPQFLICLSESLWLSQHLHAELSGFLLLFWFCFQHCTVNQRDLVRKVKAKQKYMDWTGDLLHNVGNFVFLHPSIDLYVYPFNLPLLLILGCGIFVRKFIISSSSFAGIGNSDPNFFEMQSSDNLLFQSFESYSAVRCSFLHDFFSFLPYYDEHAKLSGNFSKGQILCPKIDLVSHTLFVVVFSTYKKKSCQPS